MMIVPAPVVSSHFSAARLQFEELVAGLESRVAMEMTHGEAEEFIHQGGLEVLRRLLEGWIKAQGPGDEVPLVMGIDGVERSERRMRGRQMESIFGRIDIRRLSYEKSGVESLRPLDAELNLPGEIYSHGVRKRVAKQAAKNSFDEVVEGIEESTGAQVPKRQAEELTQRAALDVDAFYRQQRSGSRAESQGSSASLLVMTGDGKGVPMRTEDLRPETRKAAQARAEEGRKKRLSKGEKRHSKRMANVAAVFSVEEFVRSPEQIVAELRAVREATEERRPRPQNKRLWASVQKEMKEVVREMFQEALARDPDKSKRWVAVIDGNKSQIRLIRKYAKRYAIEMVLVLDLIHVLEYVWKASYVFHKEGSVEAEEWTTRQLREILHGRASEAAASLRRSATLAGLSDKKRKPLDKCADYLTAHPDMVRYDQFLAAGLPIASGVIEGACRYLVKDRMERTGARWSLKGAEAVLRLRAVYVSGDFEEYWPFHLQQEWQRNYAELLDAAPLREPQSIPAEPRPTHLRVIK